MTLPKSSIREAVRGSFACRRAAGLSRSDPVCVFDLVETLGVEVHYISCESIAGVYDKTSQTILLSIHRPPGHKAFTCAHELAHWYFEHGTRVDALDDPTMSELEDTAERQAHIFAGYLLMPSWAVQEAFKKRMIHPASCTPQQLYSVANQLGVGYETLVKHLLYSLHEFSAARAKDLLKTTPKQIRHEIVGDCDASHLLIVDKMWSKVPVDLEAGHVALLPPDVVTDSKELEILQRDRRGTLLRGKAPGIFRATVQDGSWAVYVRVSRQGFTGRSIYRHLEDAND